MHFIDNCTMQQIQNKINSKYYYGNKEQPHESEKATEANPFLIITFILCLCQAMSREMLERIFRI